MNIGHFQYLGPMGKPKKQDRTTNLTGSTNERPGTDHGTSGPMRGLEKKLHLMAQTDIQVTDGHGDSMTNSAQRGRVGENRCTSEQ